MASYHYLANHDRDALDLRLMSLSYNNESALDSHLVNYDDNVTYALGYSSKGCVHGHKAKGQDYG